ncbi:MAG: efflux RND transporter permease subunit, partial [Holophagae bacterium]|nr:efflux RND transporter permease subunit [Holophagae bacterium]
MTSIGTHPSTGARGPMAGQVQSAAHLAEVSVELISSENRTMSSTSLVDRWRNLTRSIPDVVALDFTSSLFNAGEDINIQFTGKDMETLRSASDDLKDKLREFNGVFDIADSFRAGKKEVKLKIKPEAEMLNLTQMNMARQVRQAFYGEEAQRIQRGRDDVRIMVRYSEEERETLGSLEEMRIRTPGGVEVPFNTVAEAELGRGYSTIDRVDRRRSINVTAAVNPEEANANEVITRLEDVELKELLSRYPGLSYSLEGEQKEMKDSMISLGEGFLIAVIFIFVLIAVPLKSYVQPLIIMSAIPFGLVGALLGHIFMGYNVSILSLFGVVALSGVVVNDSLILVDAVNKNRAKGLALLDSVTKAGAVRLRPILLTSLTTFGGLMPLIMEKSMQAKFMIPMAISLGFGIMFATLITLILVPTLYIILADLRHAAYWLLGREDVVKSELWIHE